MELKIINNWYDDSNPISIRQVTICDYRKKCIVCGRMSSIIEYKLTTIFGWRVCYEHLSIGARFLLESYFKGVN